MLPNPHFSYKLTSLKDDNKVKSEEKKELERSSVVAFQTTFP